MKKLCIIIMVILSHCLHAQHQLLKPLLIGEKVPNISLGKLLIHGNIKPYQDTPFIADFKGKLLIIDFWSATCSACIQSFPKLVKLQNKFKDELAIVTVGFRQEDNKGRSWGDVEPLINEWKGTPKEMKLPVTKISENRMSIDGESALRRLFPFKTVPTIVWIDKDGIFRGLTEGNAVTEKNIQDMLDGQILPFKMKQLQRSANTDSSFLVYRNPHKKIPRGTSFSKYKDSLRFQFLTLDTSKKDVYHFYAVNNPVRMLYAEAYKYQPEGGLWTGDFLNRMIIEDNGFPFYKDLIYFPDADNWTTDEILENNYFSYEKIMPKTAFASLADAYKSVIEDFDGFFGIESRIEKRKLPVSASFKQLSNDSNRQSIEMDMLVLKKRPPLQSANAILEQASKRAKKEKKNIFIMFTASWCINCHAFKDDILNNDSSGLKKMFDDNYVIEYIVANEKADKKYLENRGANELLSKYTFGKPTGIPFWIILDKDGNLLADSFIRSAGVGMNQSGENIGRPYTAEEVAAFINILKRTSNMSDEELAKIRKKCNPAL